MYQLSFADTVTIGLLDTGALSAEQALAQQIATEAPALRQQIGANRADVFHISHLPTYQPDDPDQCQVQSCYQVDVYLWESNSMLVAIVASEQGKLIDLHHYADTQPLFNAQLAERASELLMADVDLATALGHQPTADEIALMDGQRGDADGCDGGELCVTAPFITDSGSIWAIVNLTRDRVERIWWEDRPMGADESAKLYRAPVSAEFLSRVPTDCDTTLTHSGDGWSLSYGQSSTDGLHAWGISYLGTPIADSIKVPEWHVDYTVQSANPTRTGFIDYNACRNTRNRGAQFAIFAYGPPEIRPLVITTTTNLTETIGFEIVQDYRQFNWGNDCNYRYDQRYQFFEDGRWRVVAGSFGRGCGDNMLEEAHYRPLIRIDLATNYFGNQFEAWDGSEWVLQSTESWHGDGDAYGDGYLTNADGYAFRVHDGNRGFYIEPGNGQFNDGGTGDNGWLFQTLYKSEEGAADMPRIGDCCNRDYQQGPEVYLNGETTEGEDIVLWVVADQASVTTYGAENGAAAAPYCWTETVNEAYPCLSGPMFIPTTVVSPTAVANRLFSAESPTVITSTLVFGTIISIATIALRRRTHEL